MVKVNPKTAKNAKLLKTYGITLRTYGRLCKVWGNKCAVCEQPETMVDPRTKQPRGLAVDHDHKAGHIRGVLCSKCNRGIGMLNEDLKILTNAIHYLEASQKALEEHNAINPIGEEESPVRKHSKRNGSR